FIFSFHATAPTALYTLSLHDALPISKLARAAGLLGTAPIWIDDSAMLTPLAMRSKARRLKAEHDVGMVVVDYLQMMQGPTDAERDRKSTRLNSSHDQISYAVFCLKKK